jgi:8-amino-7-oxononanoate synthase
MDGDRADLAGLAQLKATHPFVLLLDEAHATGVYGPDGGGLALELGLSGCVDVSVVTLSKAIGCTGGAVCGSRALCDAVVNFGRAGIYSTNFPAPVAAAATEAIAVMRDEPQRQRRVRALSRHVREQLRPRFVLPEGESPIIPIVLGEEARALQAAKTLHDAGLLVIAVRPPSVPRGLSRLRVTVSCDHSDAEIESLCGMLSDLA